MRVSWIGNAAIGGLVPARPAGKPSVSRCARGLGRRRPPGYRRLTHRRLAPYGPGTDARVRPGRGQSAAGLSQPVGTDPLPLSPLSRLAVSWQARDLLDEDHRRPPRATREPEGARRLVRRFLVIPLVPARTTGRNSTALRWTSGGATSPNWPTWPPKSTASTASRGAEPADHRTARPGHPAVSSSTDRSRTR